MDTTAIPLIIRGRIIESDLVNYPTRGGRASFQSPDVRKYLPQLVLADPMDLSDLYQLSLDDIIDYLVQLGTRLDVETNPHLQQALEMSLGASTHTDDMQRYMFQALPSIMRREVIEEVLERNVGRAYLEGWVEEQLLDRIVHVRAFGARAVHVIAGNASVISLQTVMYNALSRSDAIIKIPSNDPYFSTALARTMIEMAPDHPVTKHLSVAYWRGGDEEVEKWLYDPANVEKIVAWGGFDSMRSIRNYLAPGLDLVALDPKLSASIIGREALATEEMLRDVAQRAAADVGHFNQGGCVSARVLYLECGTDPPGLEMANRFGQLVFDAVQDLPGHLSSPAPAFDPVLKSEIDGIRYSEDFRVIGGATNEGAVIVSQDNEVVDFSERLNCRVANVVPVDSIEAALDHLTIHTQTIGIYPESLKAAVRDRCALRGGQRIVSLGFTSSGVFAGPHDAIEPLRRMLRWIRDDTVQQHTGVLHSY
jgi:hypothetical protein